MADRRQLFVEMSKYFDQKAVGQFRQSNWSKLAWQMYTTQRRVSRSRKRVDSLESTTCTTTTGTILIRWPCLIIFVVVGKIIIS